mgnify:CR=1 FL=1
MMNALGEPQRIVLLGGTSEIGLAVVERLASQPCEVVLVGRDEQALTASAARLSAHGHTLHTVVCDAAAIDSRPAALASAMAADTDVIVVAVGVLPHEQMHDVAADVATLQANGLGATSWLLHAYDHLHRQGHGTLVVLSSFAVARPRPSNFIYGAGKAMLDFVARGLVDSGAPGINILLVRPGFVRTRMTAGRKAPAWSVRPAAVADAVADRVTGPSQVVWVPGLLRWVARVVHVLPLGLLRRVDR